MSLSCCAVVYSPLNYCLFTAASIKHSLHFHFISFNKAFNIGTYCFQFPCNWNKYYNHWSPNELLIESMEYPIPNSRWNIPFEIGRFCYVIFLISHPIRKFIALKLATGLCSPPIISCEFHDNSFPFIVCSIHSILFSYCCFQ